MVTKQRILYGDKTEAYTADPSKSDIYEFMTIYTDATSAVVGMLYVNARIWKMV